jgi:hypothetical protein
MMHGHMNLKKKSVYPALEANPEPLIVTARSLVAVPNSLSWLRAYEDCAYKSVYKIDALCVAV